MVGRTGEENNKAVRVKASKIVYEGRQTPQEKEKGALGLGGRCPDKTLARLYVDVPGTEPGPAVPGWVGFTCSFDEHFNASIPH